MCASKTRRRNFEAPFSPVIAGLLHKYQCTAGYKEKEFVENSQARSRATPTKCCSAEAFRVLFWQFWILFTVCFHRRRGGYVFILLCLFVSKISQKNYSNDFHKIWWKNPLDFGGKPDHLTLGLDCSIASKNTRRTEM